jgi:transposase, IS5 family
MNLYMLGVEDKLNNNRLIRLGKMIDWSKFRKMLTGIHKNDVDPKGGQKSYDHLKMLRVLILKEWHSLSDKETEECLKVRLDFLVFSGFDLGETTPDETTICRFRNALVIKGLHKEIFDEINSQLETKGLKVRNAQGAVVDATIIESSARPRRVIHIENDREETETQVEIQESKDKDAKWLKKGKMCYYGYKGFLTTDTDHGYILRTRVEPANVSEMNKLGEMIAGIKAYFIYADKGYSSQGNRDLLKGRYKDGIMLKAARNKPLTGIQKLINRFISKERYIIEQCNGTMKRIFGFTRASYMTQEKVDAQYCFKAICFNLLKAHNKAVSLNYAF